MLLHNKNATILKKRLMYGLLMQKGLIKCPSLNVKHLFITPLFDLIF